MQTMVFAFLYLLQLYFILKCSEFFLNGEIVMMQTNMNLLIYNRMNIK